MRGNTLPKYRHLPEFRQRARRAHLPWKSAFFPKQPVTRVGDDTPKDEKRPDVARPIRWCCSGQALAVTGTDRMSVPQGPMFRRISTAGPALPAYVLRIGAARLWRLFFPLTIMLQGYIFQYSCRFVYAVC